MWNFIYVISTVLFFSICANSTTNPLDIDIDRAHQVIPRSHFRGNSFKHGSDVLNDHLKNVKGLITRDCESFSNSELEDILVALEAVSITKLGEIYKNKSDNRMLFSSPQMLIEFQKDRDALKQLQKVNDTEAFFIDELIRDKKCIQIVLRYAHHLTYYQRRNIHKLGFIEALPLLPTLSTNAISISSHLHDSKMTIDRYTKTVNAIQCHVVVDDDGCPGGDFTSCISICPGIPNPPPNLVANCKQTCTDFCEDSIDHVSIEASNNSPIPISVKSKKIDPPYWGGSWQTVMSRNSTGPDGTDLGFRACMRWYDWSRFALRTDCTRNGVTSISLHVREKLYQIFTSPEQLCLASDLGITPVSPYWLQEGARFVGEEKINEVLTYVWDKKEPEGDSHLYKVAASDGRLVQMLTTGVNGEKNQKDYVNYLEIDLDMNIFEPPSFCDHAKVLPLEEMLSLEDVIIDI